MTWKKKIAGTAAMFILGFIFILPVLWIVMNSIKTSPEIAADFLALPKSLYLDNFKNAICFINKCSNWSNSINTCFWRIFRYNTLSIFNTNNRSY